MRVYDQADPSPLVGTFVCVSGREGTTFGLSHIGRPWLPGIVADSDGFSTRWCPKAREVASRRNTLGVTIGLG